MSLMNIDDKRFYEQFKPTSKVYYKCTILCESI